MTDEPERCRRLLDEGARLLHASWDDGVAMVRDAEHGSRHAPRGTLAYARVLLDDRAAVPDLDVAARRDRAVRAIDAVLALQETRPNNAHCGNFRWALEEETVRDLNGVEFMLDALIPIAREHASRLPPATADAIRGAIALGLDEIDRLDVHPSYTNIYLSDVCNSVLGGELAGEDRYVDRGARRLEAWFAFTSRSGAPHEYNSPTYLAVDLARMAALAEHAADPSIALRARVAEEWLWLHVAAHWHPRLLQLAGPHARSYFDGWTGASGYLKLMLWRVLGDDDIRRASPYARDQREEGHVAIALDPLHCPDYIVELLKQKPFPFDARETVDQARGIDITTSMTESYALGTASSSYAVGDPPEPSLQPNAFLLHFRRDDPPGFGSLTSRYIINEKRAGAPIGDGVVDDLWDEGQVVSAQRGNRAVVAYGLLPRDRPIRSAKLSLRLLGAGRGTEVWVGDRRVDAFPAQVAPGDGVVVAEGGVYVALIPLEPTDMGSDAPIVLNRDGDLLTLDMYNYRGPSKVFWEYRTLGGAFYRGNVQNAFAIEVAEPGDYADTAAFRAHIAGARITDDVQNFEREITFASGDAAIAMRYSLWDMRLIERRFDGEPYAAPSARFASPSGCEAVFSRDSVLRAAGATLISDRTPKWSVALDGGSARYVFIHPTDEESPVRLELPSFAIECDAFGFGRIEYDHATRNVVIDADGLIGPVHLDGAAADLRLILNGHDVTGSLA